MSIFLKAAEKVALYQNIYSCSALIDAGKERGRGSLRARIRYTELFAPEDYLLIDKPHRYAWGVRWSRNQATQRNCRVLALLFMHWIEESEQGSRKSKKK